MVEQEGCVCLPVDGSGLLGGSPPGEKQIERLTLSLAGQPVAVLVSGEVSERNGTYYFMGDHPSTALGTGLGGSNVLVDKSDNSIVPGSRTFYQPFGGYRGDLPDQGLTDQGYTGHKHNDDLGLVYMNARYYLPGTGRFASADTVVPGKENPQAFNRYTYVANNPLLFVDESGHCWGAFSFARDINVGGYGYGTTCANIDQALSIVQHPDATVGEKALAGGYIGTQVVAHGTAVVGSTVAAVGCLTGAGTAICTGAGSAVTAASADGNPTNEVVAATRAVSAVGQRGAQIWGRVSATQPIRPGTQIPKSFVLDNTNGKFWVHPHATTHMAEFLHRGPAGQTTAANQLLLEGFDDAVTIATKNGINFNRLITTNNGWELKFVQKASDLYPVINHALYRPN